MSTIDETNPNAAGDENINVIEKSNSDKISVNSISSNPSQILTINDNENASGDTVSKPQPILESTLDTIKNDTNEDKDASNEPKNNGPSKNVKDDVSSTVNVLVPKAEADLRVSDLEQELKRRTIERDCYRKKLEDTEQKFLGLKSSFDMIVNAEGDEKSLRRSMKDLKNKLDRTTMQLEDRSRVVANQENQINALNSQVNSLKEVVSITKDLLNIRNMEVKHLQQEVDSMETRITEERTRHNTMLKKMDDAARLNADLKKEYEIQLSLFQNLRGKYEEKVNILSEEKRILESANNNPSSPK